MCGSWRSPYFTLRTNPSSFAFRQVVTIGSLQGSQTVVAALRDRYESRLRQAIPEGTQLRWHTGRQRANAVNDQRQALHPHGGYTLKPGEAADWAVAVCGAWARLVVDDPPHGLSEAARSAEAGGGVG